jgi:adenosylhomocysteinase
MNVNDSVTKKFTTSTDAATAWLTASCEPPTSCSGKVAVICGRGDVGRCASPLRGQGLRHCHRDHPICEAGADEGYEVKTIEDVVDSADIFITATGNRDVIRVEHMARMKHNATVGNIGHFDNEIDMAALAKVAGIRKLNIKNPQEHGNQVDQWIFPDGHAIIILAEGRLLNLGCATGHPSFVMSNSFSNQVIAQIELFGNTGGYGNEVYVLPKSLDEKVARLHLGKLGARLTALSQAQADYIGVPVQGPYKSAHYRY